MNKKTLPVLMTCLVCFLSLIFAGCGKNTQAAETVKYSPLPQNIQADTMTDASVHVSFNTDSLTGTENSEYTLSFEAFGEVYYDAVDVHLMKTGDTVVTEDGKESTISSVEKTETGEVRINGGAESGGITLWPVGGGIYVRKEADNDRSVYASLGTTTLPLAENFVFTDNSDSANSGKTYSAAEFGDVLHQDTRGFNRYNTVLRVEAGKIAEIVRSYTP